MSEVVEGFRIMEEIRANERHERFIKYEPLIKEVGAIKTSEGVYMKDNYLIYPTKGFVMDKRTYKKKSIDIWLSENK